MPKSDFNFHFPFRVRCAEVDFQGIVFNSHYLTYFDTAITEYFRVLPYDFIEHVTRTGTDFHIVKALVEFFGPSHFDDEIEAHVRTARIGRSSMTFVVEIFPKNEETTLVRGEIVWVNTDQNNHKSAPVQQDLIDLIKAKEGDGLEL